MGASMQFDTFGLTAAELTRKQIDKEQEKRLLATSCTHSHIYTIVHHIIVVVIRYDGTRFLLLEFIYCSINNGYFGSIFMCMSSCLRPSAIPGPVPDELVVPTSESIGSIQIISL